MARSFLQLVIAVLFVVIASANKVQRSKRAQHLSTVRFRHFYAVSPNTEHRVQLRNKRPPARRVGPKPAGNGRKDFSARKKVGDGFTLNSTAVLMKAHTTNMTTDAAQETWWTDNHTAKKALPEIERAACIESAAMEKRGEGACVWSQTTCHVRQRSFLLSLKCMSQPFMLQKLGGICEPNQCDSPCASAREALMRFPPLRPACRVPALCYGGPKIGLRATSLRKPAKMCGFDDMAHSAFDVKPIEDARPVPSGTGYERSFYVYGFGGQKGR